MEKLVIQGGRPLFGAVKISGSKKSVLALISAALLANEPCIIENVPQSKDVHNYVNILNKIGIRSYDQDASTLIIDPLHIAKSNVSLKQKTRQPISIYLLGALLGRYTEFSIEKPPCSIDHHLKGFYALGANIEQRDGFLYVSAPRLTGSKIYLDSSDIPLTINLMLAAVRAEGVTLLQNAPKDPEVIDLAIFLSAMGARVRGAGTDTIRVEQTNQLRGCMHALIPDRIEAGFYMILAAATRGKIQVDRIIPSHLKPISAKLREMGAEVREEEESIFVSGEKNRFTSIDIKTLPYPGFPIDLVQPFLTLLTQANGTSLVTSYVSSNYFPLVDNLKKMGANIKVVGQTVIVQGLTQLKGQEISIRDSSSSTALLIASLISTKQTILSGCEALKRNDHHLLEKLIELDAAIRIK